MNKHDRKQGLALTFLISLIVFLIQILVMVVAGAAFYILLRTGAITISGEVHSRIGAVLLHMFAVSTVVGAFISFACAQISTSPLHKMIRQIDRLASGDFKARLSFGMPLCKSTSFARLAESFNKMAQELENTEVLRVDFINNFSHEFKTPIVSIAGFAKLLRRGNLTDTQKEEYLSIIEEESLRLSYMATNVLNLTRVENQTILTDITKYNLSEQLRSCVLLLVDKWEKKGLNFKVNFREHFIYANEELLKQVWINLIDNAIKFSSEKSTVEIGINDDGETVSVYILNSGEKIPVESQTRIFNKFYQADSSHSAEGNGIGLAVVKKVVELHSGTVSVQSANQLTMFAVTLPKNQ